MLGRAGCVAAVITTLLLPACALSCASTPTTLSRFDALEPTELAPIRACIITCTEGGIIAFEPQHLCSHGRRQFTQSQLIGRVLDHYLACREYSTAAHHCTLAREIPRENIVLGSCDMLITSIRQEKGASAGTLPGEDGMGHPLGPPQH